MASRQRAGYPNGEPAEGAKEPLQGGPRITSPSSLVRGRRPVVMEEVLKRQEERLPEVLWDFVKKYKARLQLRPLTGRALGICTVCKCHK